MSRADRASRFWLTLIAAGLLLGLGAKFWVHWGEDYVYYYCAGRLIAGGVSPYQVEPYQACIEAILGHPNPHRTTGTDWSYPPGAAWLLAWLSGLRYPLAPAGLCLPWARWLNPTPTDRMCSGSFHYSCNALSPCGGGHALHGGLCSRPGWLLKSSQPPGSASIPRPGFPPTYTRSAGPA